LKTDGTLDDVMFVERKAGGDFGVDVESVGRQAEAASSGG